MNRKGKGRAPAVLILIAMPVFTILMSLLGAKLILSEIISIGSLSWIACGITGIVAFVLCLMGALKSTQKKLLWGMLIAAAYCCMLLLGNLLFFGIGYGNIASVIISVFIGGVLGSLLGAVKRRKFA